MSRKKVNINTRSLFASLMVLGAGITWELALLGGFEIGLSPDSAKYLSVARSLLQGQGWQTYQATPLTVFPPFFPSVLAFWAWIFHADPLMLAPFLHGVLWGSMAFLSMFYLNRFGPLWLSILLAALLFISQPMVQIFTMLWSEPLFLTLWFGLLIYLELYRRKPSPKYIYSLTILSILIALTRYVGAVVIVWVAIWISIFSPRSKRIFRAGYFFIISISPLVSWILRNIWLTRTPFGPRQFKDSFNILDSLLLVVYKVSEWYIPSPILKFKGSSILILLTVSYLAVYTIYKREYIRKYVFFAYALLSSWIFIYLLTLLVTSSTIYFDQINQRLLSPIFPASTMLLILLLYHNATVPLKSKLPNSFYLLRKHRRRSLKCVHLVQSAILLLWIFMLFGLHLSQLNKVILPLRQGERGGWGWKENNLLVFLRSSQRAREKCKVIYSNSPWLVYLWGEFVPSRPLPRKGEKLDIWAQHYSSPGSCYLWLVGVPGQFIEIRVLLQILPLELIWRGKEGSLYLQYANGLKK
ncbi:MAG: hypothetical protein GXO36_02510 [Chloroflexi bacterium]|nr:hypothetical protein [Chloroflexota bacterium]